ncbi:MAG: Rpn family recombination-promoting nuclease/putative transposase, partial [Cytophagales bacterium]|nr:Rpn family recombination-promoting nuclease/putative transposase [Cytophagales bacterium]
SLCSTSSMPKKKQPRQAQSYDKIFKENLKKAFDELIPQLTGLRMENYEDLNPDFQRTIEQKTDYLFRVTNRDETYALQVEFQAKNDPDMLRRMLLYRSLIYHRENLTVRQVVFYVGKDALDMKNNLRQPSLSFNYRLIDMTRIPYRRFRNRIT